MSESGKMKSFINTAYVVFRRQTEIVWTDWYAGQQDLSAEVGKIQLQYHPTDAMQKFLQCIAKRVEVFQKMPPKARASWFQYYDKEIRDMIKFIQRAMPLMLSTTDYKSTLVATSTVLYMAAQVLTECTDKGTESFMQACIEIILEH